MMHKRAIYSINIRAIMYKRVINIMLLKAKPKKAVSITGILKALTLLMLK